MLIIWISSVVWMCTCAAWLYPRVTTYADRFLTTSRFVVPTTSFEPSPVVHTPHKTAPTALVDIVEHMARQITSGVHGRDAIIEATQSCFGLSMADHIVVSVQTESLSGALRTCEQYAISLGDHEAASMWSMLNTAHLHGVFLPAALHDVAGVLRSHKALQGELRSASAQAGFTARILTLMPLGVLGFMMIASSQIRHSLTSPYTLGVLILGLVLNRCGAVWIRYHVARIEQRPVDDITTLTEHLAISLRAGCSIVEALTRWEHVCELGTHVARAVTHGSSLQSALSLLPNTSEASRLSHSILATQHDGLPIAATVHQLVNDARTEIRRRNDISVRQLPSQLSFPLVLCILPSFLLIAVVPLMFNALGQLGPALSPPINIAPSS